MKKWVMLLVLCLTGVAAMAQMGPKLENLRQKVKKMQVITYRDVPYDFIWDKSFGECRQDDINVFYLAKQMYEKHPDNFAAVFNYGVLILSNGCMEGPMLSDMQIDEGYKILEKAKKLRPNHLEIYERQEGLIDYQLFGDLACFAAFGYTLDERIEMYRARPDLARKRLALIEKQRALGSKKLTQNSLFEAYVICTALRRTEAAAKYLAMPGMKKQLAIEKQMVKDKALHMKWLQEQEHARPECVPLPQRQQKAAKASLIQRLKKAFSFGK